MTMTTTRTRTRNSATRAATYSVLAHSVALSFLFLRSWSTTSETPYVPTLRVDLVALPNKTRQELNETTPVESAPVEKKVVAPPEEKPTEDKNNKPMSTPEKLDEGVGKRELDQRRKRMERALQKLKALQSLRTPPPEAMIHEAIRGNELSKGTSALGEKNDAISYWTDAVVQRIRQNWDLPVWLKRQNLRAKIEIEVERSGQLSALRWLERSNNETFDQAVERSVRDGLPFPKSPSGSGSLRIELGFPL
jgi:outer membrane biosynthesis protein TonB